MRVVVADTLANHPSFHEAFADICPGTRFYHWPDKPDDGNYDLLVAWQLPPDLAELPQNLSALLCFGAGIDGLQNDPRIPAGLPITRLLDSGQAQQISNYALHVAYARVMEDQFFREKQGKKEWFLPDGPRRPVGDLKVCVLGLGFIGGTVAATLAKAGYNVHGWSRSAKDLSGVTAHSGEVLHDAARGADVVINLLPLNNHTSNVLDAQLFGALSTGAYIANLGRGGHLVEAHLKEALEGGQIGCAFLDAFRSEPLDGTSWLWLHPRVRITPHVAGLPTARGTARSIANVLAAIRDGSPLPALVISE